MKKYPLNVNHVIAKFVTLLNIGLLRKLRFIRIPKIKIYLRLLALSYNSGLLRTLRIKVNYVEVYFKFKHGQPIGRYTLISRPGKRCRWSLKVLANNYNKNNFAGFYIISTQKGLMTSDYCLLEGHKGGEVLMKVEI